MDPLFDALSGPGAGFLYLLAAVGALALAIVAERTVQLRRWTSDAEAVLRALDADAPEQALATAGDTPLADVLRAGLDQRSPEAAWEAMGGASAEAEESLRGRLPHLPPIADLATMLGLLGTVYGLVLAFSALGDAAAGERAVRLSTGIATAMATTAAGLGVAIPTTAAHALLDARVRRSLVTLEAAAARVVLLQRRRCGG